MKKEIGKKIGDKLRKSKETFIEESNQKFGIGKFDFSNFIYINNKTKGKVICTIHGEFEQTPDNHLHSKKGCKQCGVESIWNEKRHKTTTKEIIEKFERIHNFKYNYSRFIYIDNITEGLIICSTHGPFEQTPAVHLRGGGCPKCSKELLSKKYSLGNEGFIKKSIEIHGENSFDFSKLNYKNNYTNVTLICNQSDDIFGFHGEFEQLPSSHFRGSKCPKCSNKSSKNEIEILDFIKELYYDHEIIENDRQLLKGKELDIYIPSLKIAFEYNGLYWHNEINKPKDYHLNKTTQCENIGIKVLHIWEDEWVHKKEIVKNYIKNHHTKHNNKSFEIKEVNDEQTNRLLYNNLMECNHKKSTLNLGLYIDGEIKSLVSFSKKNNKYKLLNYFTTLNNGIEELLNFFIKNYHPKTITYTHQKRLFKCDELIKHGFVITKTTHPKYYYIDTHKILRFNKNPHNQNLQKIYDCGEEIYELKC